MKQFLFQYNCESKQKDTVSIVLRSPVKSIKVGRCFRDRRTATGGVVG